MYQAKQRLNSFGQPNFLRKNEPKNTFWEEEEEILPFKLSIPEYFTPQAVDTFNEKQKSSRARGNFRPNIVSNHPANKQQTKQRRSHSRSFANRQSDSYIYNRPHSTLQSYFAQKIYTNWIEKELYFSMSKLSFLVLVVGLFFLSSLLFITGFLVAVNIYDIGTLKTNQNYNTNLPVIETPHISTPTLAMPTVSSLNTQIISPPVQIQPNTQNPNMIRSQNQEKNIGNAPIVSNNPPHMPSVYAQLPTQVLPPVSQPIPENGAYYSPNQYLPVTGHAPLQNYANTQQQLPVMQAPAQVQAPAQIMAQPPVQQHYPYPPQNNAQPSSQVYSSPTNQPAPQPYQNHQNPAPYYNSRPGVQ